MQQRKLKADWMQLHPISFQFSLLQATCKVFFSFSSLHLKLPMKCTAHFSQWEKTLANKGCFSGTGIPWQKFANFTWQLSVLGKWLQSDFVSIASKATSCLSSLPRKSEWKNLLVIFHFSMCYSYPATQKGTWQTA